MLLDWCPFAARLPSNVLTSDCESPGSSVFSCTGTMWPPPFFLRLFFGPVFSLDRDGSPLSSAKLLADVTDIAC